MNQKVRKDDQMGKSITKRLEVTESKTISDGQLYQVGNTSSRKITEVKQRGPRLILGWDSRVGRECCSYKYYKIPLNASGGKNEKNKKETAKDRSS